MELYCKYCNEIIEGKSYTAYNEKYHLQCLRKFKKDIDKQKMLGKIKEGQENKVKTIKYINNNKLQS